MALPTKSVAVRVNITPALHAELVKIADRRDVSLAHVIRRAIRSYLTNGDTTDDH